MADRYNVEDVTEGADTIEGTDDTDIVTGSAGDDTIKGGKGFDVLRGGSGADEIHGGDSRDVIRGGSGDDTLYGDAGDDVILGDAGADTIYGGADDDTLLGGGGNDTLTGGSGADTFAFRGSSGEDTIKDFNAADGDTIDLSLLPNALSFTDLTLAATTDGTGAIISHTDLGKITLENVKMADVTADMFQLPDGNTDSITTGNVVVSKWEDPFEGDDDSDFLVDGANDTRIVGKGGDDTIMAGEGADKLEGGAGADWLFGEEGADTLDGGADADNMWGGAGADTFVFQAGHGEDCIRDFENGADTIDLTALTQITQFSDLTVTTEDGNTVIDMTAKGGGKIILEDFASTNLDATDFDFYGG